MVSGPSLSVKVPALNHASHNKKKFCPSKYSHKYHSGTVFVHHLLAKVISVVWFKLCWATRCSSTLAMLLEKASCPNAVILLKVFSVPSAQENLWDLLIDPCGQRRYCRGLFILSKHENLNKKWYESAWPTAVGAVGHADQEVLLVTDQPCPSMTSGLWTAAGQASRCREAGLQGDIHTNLGHYRLHLLRRRTQNTYMFPPAPPKNHAAHRCRSFQCTYCCPRGWNNTHKLQYKLLWAVKSTSSN